MPKSILNQPWSEQETSGRECTLWAFAVVSLGLLSACMFLVVCKCEVFSLVIVDVVVVVVQLKTVLRHPVLFFSVHDAIATTRLSAVRICAHHKIHSPFAAVNKGGKPSPSILLG